MEEPEELEELAPGSGPLKIMVTIRVTLGLYWGSMGDNGKENGNYYNGLYRGYIGFDIGLCGWSSKLWSLFGYPKY